MRLDSVDTYARSPASGPLPVAIMICETAFMVTESATLLHQRGFGHVIAIGPGISGIDADAAHISAFPAPVHAIAERTQVLNRLIEAHRGQWVFICFNGEFLFYPFAETRSVSDLIEFMWAERRSSVMTYGIDLYSDQMIGGGMLAHDDAWFDAEGWYGFDRGDGFVDVHGGLGWRYEEYVPVATSRINRPALFLSRPGLTIRDDLWLADDDLNTVACPWHNNPTLALMTTRRARMLLEHPTFKSAVSTLTWPGSVKFGWQSNELVHRGLIEAGQWM